MTRPDVSILLVSWNTRALTLSCLDSLPAGAGGVSFETIVVDNGSHDGSAEALAGRSDVELVLNEANRGYAAAVNQAYAHARGELILLLNSDVRLAPGALAELARFLRERSDVAGVGPLYVNPDGSPQSHHYRALDLGAALALATGLRRLPPLARRLRAHRMADEDFSRPRAVPQPSASCLLLRRSPLGGGAPLDERFPLFFSDVELARRLRAGGHALWMTPAAVAVHELGASTRLLGSGLPQQHLGSLVRYISATRSRPLSMLVKVAVALDWTGRRVLRRSTLSPRELLAVLRGDPGPLPGRPEADALPWVVYMSAIPWRFQRNRQQELACQLAQERRVLFVEPPGLRPCLRLRVERLGETLWRARAPVPLPLGRFLPLANRLNRRFAARALRRRLGQAPAKRLLWIDEDLAAPAIGRLGESAVVYDAADLDWTFTRPWNRRHLRRALHTAVARADLVLASSPVLARTLSSPGRRAVELPNACDPGHFRPHGLVAAVLEGIPRPRLGYVGAIDERAFDAPLVASLARLRPDWSLVLAGPSSEATRNELAGLPNVHLLGPVAYDEVPALLRGFDVCLIPYRTAGRSGYVHPKKFYEYLAAGRPVVSTPLAALAANDAPHRSAATPEDFVAAVEAALGEAGSPELVRARRAAACAHTWNERGERLRGLLPLLEERTA